MRRPWIRDSLCRVTCKVCKVQHVKGQVWDVFPQFRIVHYLFFGVCAKYWSQCLPIITDSFQIQNDKIDKITWPYMILFISGVIDVFFFVWGFETKQVNFVCGFSSKTIGNINGPYCDKWLKVPRPYAQGKQSVLPEVCLVIYLVSSGLAHVGLYKPKSRDCDVIDVMCDFFLTKFMWQQSAGQPEYSQPDGAEVPQHENLCGESLGLHFVASPTHPSLPAVDAAAVVDSQHCLLRKRWGHPNHRGWVSAIGMRKWRVLGV